MRTLLAAMLAACALGASGSAMASSTGSPAATFYSVGDEPILRYDNTPLPDKKLGGVSVDTVTAPGVTNVMFQFHRNGLPELAEYDFLADFEAWGELPAVMLIDANIGSASSSVLGSGPFSILYNGAADLLAGGKTYKTGARLLFGTIIFDDWNIWGYAGSDFGCCGLGGPSQFAFELSNVEQDGFITTASLGNGSFYATVPEPATWAMMIIGFGIVGAALRRTQHTSTSWEA